MLRLLMDEHIDPAIVTALRQRQPSLDIVTVQEVGLAHTPDPDILEWAAQHGRVVISRDKKTLGPDAWARVTRGLPMPGVAILLPRLALGDAIDEIEYLALASDPDDVKDLVVYLPRP